jgi:hypothetical protein
MKKHINKVSFQKLDIKYYLNLIGLLDEKEIEENKHNIVPNNFVTEKLLDKFVEKM